ncbi:MAG: hypothetical protein AB7G48_13265 [Nitrospiraceae bacterium]
MPRSECAVVRSWPAAPLPKRASIPFLSERPSVSQYSGLTPLLSQETIAKRADSDRLLGLLQEIDAIQRNSTRNLNAQLVLEHLLLQLREAVAPDLRTPVPSPRHE